MSTTIGAIPSAIPAPRVATAVSASNETTGETSPQTQSPVKAEAQGDGIAPMPIQPLSNRMLATFMQKDIELYGSTFGV